MFSAVLTIKVGRTGTVITWAWPLSTNESGVVGSVPGPLKLFAAGQQSHVGDLAVEDLGASQGQILPNLHHLLPVWHLLCDPLLCTPASLWGSFQEGALVGLKDR